MLPTEKGKIINMASISESRVSYLLPECYLPVTGRRYKKDRLVPPGVHNPRLRFQPWAPGSLALLFGMPRSCHLCRRSYLFRPQLLPAWTSYETTNVVAT